MRVTWRKPQMLRRHGPIALLVVELVRPQGPWSGAAKFAERYHPLQTLPFWLGLLPVGGLLTVVAALRARAGAGVPRRERATPVGAHHEQPLVSVLGAVATDWDRDWLLRPSGLVSFALWNALVIAMCAAALRSVRTRRACRLET